MRLLILQHGDYGEAYRRFDAGGPETYRDQARSVRYVAHLAEQHEVATVSIGERPHDEELQRSLRSIGVSRPAASRRQTLWPLLDSVKAELFICRSPNLTALSWSAARQLPTLPVFADTFARTGVRSLLRNFRLSRVLRRCSAPCCSNHSLAASESLERLGVPRTRIVPWDWARISPQEPPKRPPEQGRAFRLFFAGAHTAAKGVGDCIEAVAIARHKGFDITITLAGPGDSRPWRDLAARHAVSEHVHFLGVIPSADVLRRMREHDAVVVPSRHEYAEGLPNTIFEALASRSPLIASDHPAYTQRLQAGTASLKFRAGVPGDLAHQMIRLAQDPNLYERLSKQSAGTLDGLYVGIEWTRLLDLFIEDPSNSTSWVERFSLSRIQPGLPQGIDRHPDA